MAGHDIFTYECSLKAHNMATKITLHKDKDKKSDPELHLQQILFPALPNLFDIDEFLSFELAAFFLSLFEAIYFLQKGNKLNLAEKIAKIVEGKPRSDHESDKKTKNDEPNTLDRNNPMTDISIATKNHQYAVDGGSLMHRIWRKNKTYGEIAEHCADFVLAKPFMEIYREAILVFDGYGRKTSTKDITHLR